MSDRFAEAKRRHEEMYRHRPDPPHIGLISIGGAIDAGLSTLNVGDLSLEIFRAQDELGLSPGEFIRHYPLLAELATRCQRELRRRQIVDDLVMGVYELKEAESMFEAQKSGLTK